MKKWGSVSDQVLRMLEEFGPMTRTEICANLGRDKKAIASIVSRLARDTPRAGKRIYVANYIYDMEGERCYPRAVYAIGSKLDKPKPKPDHLAVKRRYWARRVKRLTANSVFNLALTRSQLESIRARRSQVQGSDDRADRADPAGLKVA